MPNRPIVFKPGVAPLAGLACAAALGGCAGLGGGVPGIADAALQAGPAPSAAAAGDFMGLGDPAPAPLGFLNFCARRPDQCDLADAQAPEAGTGAGERQRQLYARYYWPLIFKPAGGMDARLIPTSGDEAAVAPPLRPAGLGYDWSRVFGAAPRDAPASVEPLAMAAPAAMVLTWASKPEPAPEAAAESAPDIAAPQAQSDALPALLPTAPSGGPAAPLPVTRRLMRTLASVNASVNHAIRYVSDEALYGTSDYWTLPLEAGGPGAGDCKDYVLEKRRALAAAGVPDADLSIAIVRTSWGVTHAVLLVSTERGELVLDSLAPDIRPWRQAPYTWLERQAPGRPLDWVKVVRSPRT
ncbi:MAG TPA: transglutaminase-like cysteine peptidase [Caulobacteraceae bacterium]|nr:transglutaminase-like cysteine peptidase [Caulobacteraceae bacterium]